MNIDLYYIRDNKKLSYRRETARQLPTSRGAKPSSSLPFRPSGYTLMRMVESETRNKRTSTKRTLR